MEVYAAFYIYVLFAHFVADFMFQADWVIRSEIFEIRTLNLHMLAYASIMFVFIGPLLYWISPENGFALAAKFVIINASAHIITDYFTDKLAAKCWLKGDQHNFFVVRAFDQFLHTATLILTAFYV